jgi:hypothetical protein
MGNLKEAATWTAYVCTGDDVNMYNKENWVECGLNGSDKERASVLASYE